MHTAKLFKNSGWKVYDYNIEIHIYNNDNSNML